MTLRGIGPSIVFALGNLFHPRILWMMLWPVLAAAVFWCAVVIVFWSEITLRFAGLLQGWISTATFFINWDPAGFSEMAAKILTVIFMVPLIQFTALLVIGMVGMPAAVEHVARRRFPDLERKRGGSMAGSVWNGLASFFGMVLLFVVTLPLWIVPPLWPVIPVAILAWVNQRVLRYDALAEHASAQEMRTVFRERRTSLYALGILLAVLAFVPVAGFFAPALFSLAFAHYLLAELKASREAPIEGRVVST